MTSNNAITLSALQRAIKDAIKSSLPARYWVVAEINQLSIAAAGHCYMELIERNEDSGQTLAKSSAAIWRYNVSPLFNRFSSSTGEELRQGVKVMFLAEVSYHELYGASLVIHDVDPTYTLGEAELQRRRIIARLEKEGLLERNSEVEHPAVIQRIAIISSATAAGYGDFMDELLGNEYGYSYSTTLFQATMQGDSCQESVVAAMQQIYQSHESFDAIVIIRGGGSASDLSCFDNYEIARTIAHSPLVVIAGIGHDRDITITDMASGISLKTPTAVARFLIDSTMEYDTMLSEQRSFIEELYRGYLSSERESLEDKSLYLRDVVSRMVRDRELYYAQKHELLRHRSSVIVAARASQLEKQHNELREHSRGVTNQSREAIKSLYSKLQELSKQRVDSSNAKLELQQSNVSRFDPRHIFALGYSLAKIEGSTLRSTKQVKIGSELELMLLDGDIKANITKISEKRWQK